MKKFFFGLLLAALPSSAWADKIGDMRAKKPEFTTETTMNIFDIERCVIENVNIGKPWVYRQPDRPNAVSMVWDSREFGNTTLIEMSGNPIIKIRFWGKDKMWHVLRTCIGQEANG